MPKEKSKKGPKPFFEHNVMCAWCGKPNIVRGIKQITIPATPAQTTIEVFAEKDLQKKLDETEQKKK